MSLRSLFVFLPGLILACYAGDIFAQQPTPVNYPQIIRGASSQQAAYPNPSPYLINDYFQGSIQDQENQGQQGIGQVPIAPGDQRQFPQGPGLEVQSNAQNLDNGFNDYVWQPDRLFGCTQNGFCIGGWIQSGFHERTNGLFLTHPNRIHVHQVWIHAEKLTDPCCGRNWGFRFDAVYGVDGPNLQAFGNSPPGAPDDWDNGFDFGIYGWALPQAYVEFAAASGVKAKGGYFLAPMGTESLQSVDNFFFSRTFARFYTRPYTMSGGLLEFNRGRTTVVAGVTMGWNSAFENIGDALTFVGGIRGRTASGACYSSMFSFGETGIFGTGYASSSAIDFRLSDRLTYSLHSDFYETDAFDDISISNQLVLRASRQLGLGTRLEYYRTDRFGGDRSTWGWTNGVNIRPHQNFVLRPEARVDWGPAAPNSGQANYAVDLIMMY